MNTITKISPRPLALLIATALSGNAFAADDVLNDGETMVVQATAEEALKQQPGVSIITAKDIENPHRSTTSPILFAPCPV